MRDGIAEIIHSWTTVDDVADLSDRIERAAEWSETNGPLEPDEHATVALMIEAQFARLSGTRPGVCRRCGCTDDNCSGCVERTGEPCSWVESDLCSACVGGGA